MARERERNREGDKRKILTQKEIERGKGNRENIERKAERKKEEENIAR